MLSESGGGTETNSNCTRRRRAPDSWTQEREAMTMRLLSHHGFRRVSELLKPLGHHRTQPISEIGRAHV